MPSRTPGDQPDPAAERLGRWQAHHGGSPESSGDDSSPEEPPAPTSDPAPADEAPAQPDQPAPRHAAPRRPARGSDRTDAGREVVEALGITPPPGGSDAPAGPEAAAPTPRRQVPPVGRSTDVVFAPRVLLRRVLRVVLLVVMLAALGAGYLAYDDPSTLSVGVAGVLVLLALVLYGLLVTATPARLAIHGGQLEVVRGSQREVFDLTSRFTRMEVVGRPGRPGWKVLMARFGREPLVIDSSMVDPAQFTTALEQHRPSPR